MTANARASAAHVVGRYAIHGEIASGGMASVHFARLHGPSGFSRTVAVKRPHPHLARDPGFAAAFIDEARLAARVNHPNVVSTLDVIATADELLLVMDYVHGEALSKLARAAKEKGERVPVPIAASILIDALHGLHAAHEATDESGQRLEIVHRDVSPQNVLVGVDGISRIVDFGIAKAAGRVQGTTRDGTVKGKYAYMAPEQVRGEAVTRSADLFAASIVLWELLTGERLFQGNNDAETVHKCLVARIRPPSNFVSDLPPKMDEILRRGLARDPAGRYESARAMALDLEACVPAVRASEIGAWVARVAGSSLDARAAAVSTMERSSPGADDEPPTVAMAGSASGSTPAGEPGGAEPGGASLSVSWIAGGTASTASARSEEASHVSTVAERPMVSAVAPAAPARGGRRAAAVGGAVVGLALAAIAFTALRGRATVEAPSPIASSAAAPSIASPEAAPSASSSAAAVAAEAPSPSAAPSASASAASPAGRARPPPPAKRAKPGCNPPYSVDSLGRQIFKLECL